MVARLFQARLFEDCGVDGTKEFCKARAYPITNPLFNGPKPTEILSYYQRGLRATQSYTLAFAFPTFFMTIQYNTVHNSVGPFNRTSKHMLRLIPPFEVDLLSNIASPVSYYRSQPSCYGVPPPPRPPHPPRQR